MPAKGTRRLTDEQRADIVLLKDIKGESSSTNMELARMFSVSKNSIDRHNYEMLSDEQKALYERKRNDLGAEAFDLTLSALRKSKELVGLATVSNLSGVVAAGKFGYEAFRLETNQPTQITQTTTSPVDQAISYARLLLQKLELEDARGVYFANEKMRRIVGADEESWAGAWEQVSDDQGRG